MARPLNTMIDPKTTAVVTCEMQRGVIGDLTAGPELTAEASRVGLIDNAQRLAEAARAAGSRVVHAVVALRADRAGLTINNAIMAISVKNPNQVLEGSPYAELIPELGPEPSDIVCGRIHGLTPFTGTELDSILRNLGVRTIIPVGVSVNEALLGLCLTAADLGYQIVLPTDAIAGVPGEYAEAVVANTLAFIARLSTTAEIVDAWSAPTA